MSTRSWGRSFDAIASASVGYAGVTAEARKLSEVEAVEAQRIGTGFAELDRVLGGGFVPGSVVLIGGDPGAGKSTLLLQASTALAQHQGVLYVTGEESLQQLALRAQRLQVPMDHLSVAAETRAEVIAQLVERQRPKVVILDSIQVMHLEGLDSTPGSVAQVRETASFFTRLAKQHDIVIVLVGHITKEGGIAALASFFPKIARAYLIGEAAEDFAQTLGEIPHEFCGDLDSAVERAWAASGAGETILRELPIAVVRAAVPPAGLSSTVAGSKLPGLGVSTADAVLGTC